MDDKALQQEFGRRVSRRRRELKLTQEALASRANLSRPSLANIEAGRQSVFLAQVYRLAAALDYRSPADLLVAPDEVAPLSADIPKVSDARLTPTQRSEVLDFWHSIGVAVRPEPA